MMSSVSKSPSNVSTCAHSGPPPKLDVPRLISNHPLSPQPLLQLFLTNQLSFSSFQPTTAMACPPFC